MHHIADRAAAELKSVRDDARWPTSDQDQVEPAQPADAKSARAAESRPGARAARVPETRTDAGAARAAEAPADAHPAVRPAPPQGDSPTVSVEAAVHAALRRKASRETSVRSVTSRLPQRTGPEQPGPGHTGPTGPKAARPGSSALRGLAIVVCGAVAVATFLTLQRTVGGDASPPPVGSLADGSAGPEASPLLDAGASPLAGRTPETKPSPSGGTSSPHKKPNVPASPSHSSKAGKPTASATHSTSGGGKTEPPTPGEVSPTATATAKPPAPLTVSATRVLNRGQSIVNGPTALTMNSGGNLVLTYRGAVTWASGTTGRGNTTVFQADGNFVVYGADTSPAWSTRTDGHDGAVLVITGSGELYISYEGKRLWQA